MVAGRGYWIIVWVGILILGILGLVASIYWGRETRWKNVDELLRAVGTILVSVGMLLLLHQKIPLLGPGLLIGALLCFILAFAFGRKPARPPAGDSPPYHDTPRKSA